jgi:uroporphyrinogen-III synthase
VRSVLIIRAQPGAAETAARAAALGLESRVVPLFVAQPVAWEPAAASGFDALMLTSAHAPRLAGPALSAYRPLRCYAVGDSTASAARRAGFADVRNGGGDGEALLAQMARDGVKHALHLCGRNRRTYARPGISLTRTPVYAVDGVESFPPAALAALREAPIVLLHSPRSAAHFAALYDEAGLNRAHLCIAAISRAAAQEAGTGWERVAVADKPRDEPLLEIAAKLCKTVAA